MAGIRDQSITPSRMFSSFVVCSFPPTDSPLQNSGEDWDVDVPTRRDQAGALAAVTVPFLQVCPLAPSARL
jgi:hypothetical protein